MKITPDHITKLKASEIFVFGSNLRGDHSGGAAKYAHEFFGAEFGVADGFTGKSYALPTMDKEFAPLPPEEIKKYVDQLYADVSDNPKKHFLITPVGCGIAGNCPETIAPLFRRFNSLKNVSLPQVFLDIISPVKGYKVFNSKFECNPNGRAFKYEENKEFSIEGELVICQNGLHFCEQAADCFDYYTFNPSNIVCAVEAIGDVVTEGNKSATNHIRILKRLSWEEVLRVVNSGQHNTGRRNSGYRNSGDRNSGDSNSGDSNSGYSNSGYRNSGSFNSGARNSGDSNSGYRNSGYRNSGDRNSGDRNSGSFNSGSRNSGDSNSGYRNSGAFCSNDNPVLYLFDSPSSMTVRDWENHRAFRIMSNLDPTIWVPSSHMTDAEKAKHPSHETTEGFLRSITLHESWKNLWGNLSDEDKEIFTGLENFDADKFFQITGIKVD